MCSKVIIICFRWHNINTQQWREQTQYAAPLAWSPNTEQVGSVDIVVRG